MDKNLKSDDLSTAFFVVPYYEATEGGITFRVIVRWNRKKSVKNS